MERRALDQGSRVKRSSGYGWALARPAALCTHTVLPGPAITVGARRSPTNTQATHSPVAPTTRQSPPVICEGQ